MALENLSSLRHFGPELWLTASILAAFVGSMVRRLTWLWIPFLALALYSAFTGLSSEATYLFKGMLALDGMTGIFRLFFLLVALLTFILAAKSRELAAVARPEFRGLLLSVVLGMMLMASATNLLMAYLAMEMVSILSYALAASLKGNRRSHEAGLKYVIFGGVASGVMLFGLSILYGLTGSLDFAAIGHALAGGGANPLPLFFAMVLLLAGLGFKIAAVPFHMWCPDVYEGAPISVTAFLSVGPKAAGFALLLRLFGGAIFDGGVSPIWPGLIALLSVATMTLGNLSALWQNNLKRLMAYSSIAHAGYLLMGVVLLNTQAMTAIVFYLFAYLLMNFGAFMVIAAIANENGSEEIDGVRGLWKRHPFLAVSMAIFLFSLTGLPPTFGFVGKLYLFAALIESGWFWLAVVGLLNSVISLAYYVRIAKAMLIDEGEEEVAKEKLPLLTGISLGVLAALTLILGVYWEPLRVFAEKTFVIL